ncbi:testis-expressed protein 36 isoform X2 [Heptranchias perlo]|uniref:testis-expressed protein 36 isoform X2 n=1 Tax=Heptranchias perlo TaxID=212740 RepID=UPI00355AB465
MVRKIVAKLLHVMFCHPYELESPFCRESESTTDKSITMQKQNISPSKLNDRLPSLYKVREKNLSQGKFPFSTHDNRYSLDHTGEHLAFGLGQKKVPVAKQTAHSVELWDRGTPSGLTGRFGFTIYQTSYQGNQETERPFYRRYPKIPSKSSQSAQSRNTNDIMWFGKNNSLYRTPLEVLGITQHPLHPSDKKFHRAKSFRNNCL